MSGRGTGRRAQLALCAIVMATALVTSLTLASETHESGSNSFGAANTDWNGHSEWATLIAQSLGASRVRFVATLNYGELKPEDAIVFFNPEPSLEADSLARFMNAGGRVAVFDDFGSGSTLWRRFAINESLEPISPERKLQNNPQLAIARPHITKGSDGTDGRHPIVSGADEVVTNHPIVLAHPNLTRLLEFDTSEGPVTLALTGVIEGRGRLLVCGDSSVFLNLMLRYPGNRAFAQGVARYLLEREGTDAVGTLYVLSGDFAQTGEFGHRSLGEDARARLDLVLTQIQDAFHDGLPLAVCSGLCLALLVSMFLGVRSQGAFAETRIVHGFSGERPLWASPSSEAGRLELLTAPTTTPLLAVAELAHAFEAFLGEATHSDGPLGPEELGQALNLCSAERQKQISDLYSELCAWRRELVAKKRRLPSENELQSLHNRTMEALDSLSSLRKKDIANPYGPRHV